MNFHHSIKADNTLTGTGGLSLFLPTLVYINLNLTVRDDTVGFSHTNLQ